jgi:hypothetical protein
MSKERTTVKVTINFPIDIEVGKQGLTYITSPLIRGLFLGLPKADDKTIKDSVTGVINALTQATLIPIEEAANAITVED